MVDNRVKTQPWGGSTWGGGWRKNPDPKIKPRRDPEPDVYNQNFYELRGQPKAEQDYWYTPWNTGPWYEDIYQSKRKKPMRDPAIGTSPVQAPVSSPTIPVGPENRPQRYDPGWYNPWWAPIQPQVQPIDLNVLKQLVDYFNLNTPTPGRPTKPIR